MQLAAHPRELKVLRDLFRLEPGCYLLLKDDQLGLHFGVDVPLLVSRPETPKGV